MTTPREPPAAASPGEPGPLDGDPAGLPRRVLDVFVSPGRLFEQLRDHPVWIGPLILVTGLTLAATLLTPEALIRRAVELQMGPEAGSEQLDQALRFARIFQYVGAAIGPALLSLFLAGILMLVYNLVLGGTAEFRQLFSATTHALLVPTLGGLLLVPLMIATGDPRTTLSLHLLVPGLGREAYVGRFLAGLNVFSLWCAVLLGIAVSRIYPRRDATRAAGVLVGLYVAVKAVSALLGTG